MFKKLTPLMEQALSRYPAANAEPDLPWGVREGTRNALIARGLIEAVETRTKYTNQPYYRYRRTADGDRVAAPVSPALDWIRDEMGYGRASDDAS